MTHQILLPGHGNGLLRPGAHSPILADLVVGSNKCQSDTEAINDFRGMENSWAVPTHLLQSEGVANDLSDTIASDFPLESERKLDVFQYVATNWAVHTYDNSWSYNRSYYDSGGLSLMTFNDTNRLVCTGPKKPSKWIETDRWSMSSFKLDINQDTYFMLVLQLRTWPILTCPLSSNQSSVTQEGL
ncbi:hypothetical protein AVEN_169721-1 [Araneus ventricosus]|uniref:Uncharacterized protein n=1 Tax=Araneus ventricosus TaxID=182803 RepID=A0A4Y2TW85_ARAVE|nr:hypothetical protein AVEN_169721-1 [Araneus ventricosus]